MFLVDPSSPQASLPEWAGFLESHTLWRGEHVQAVRRGSLRYFPVQNPNLKTNSDFRVIGTLTMTNHQRSRYNIESFHIAYGLDRKMTGSTATECGGPVASPKNVSWDLENRGDDVQPSGTSLVTECEDSLIVGDRQEGSAIDDEKRSRFVFEWFKEYRGTSIIATQNTIHCGDWLCSLSIVQLHKSVPAFGKRFYRPIERLILMMSTISTMLQPFGHIQPHR